MRHPTFRHRAEFVLDVRNAGHGSPALSVGPHVGLPEHHAEVGESNPFTTSHHVARVRDQLQLRVASHDGDRTPTLRFKPASFVHDY